MNAVVAKIKSQRSEPQNSPNEVRAAYPYFHEKRTKNAAGVPFTKKDGTPNPRYCATFMFPKLAADASQCANYMFLWGLAQEAAKKMWPQNVDGQGHWVWPAGAQLAIKDGDVPFTSKPKPGQPLPSAEEIARKNEWRRGYWIVEAENFLDPGPAIGSQVGGTSRDLLTKVINGVAQYKSGDWGIVKIHAYAYQNETFGVNYGFDAFWFTREGDQIGASGGPKSASEIFAGIIPASAPVAPSPAPMPPVSPVAAPPSPAPQQYAAPAPAYPPVPGAHPMQPPAAPAPQYAPPPMPPVGVAGLPPIPGR